MTHTAMDPGGAPEALWRIAGCTRRRHALGAATALLLALAALWLRAYTWLALFVALTVPLCAAGALMLSAQRMSARLRSWRTIWAGLLVLLPGGALLAALIYKTGLSWLGVDAVNEAHVAALSLLLGILMLVLPLWRAEHHARALHVAQLSQAVLASDLKALQAQIEPHFLYNTLANTRYLVRHQPERALDMLDHLIAYLRSALPDLRSPMSTLGRECELAGHYLALMAIRYGDRLSVSIDCEDGVGDLPLPPLMLMPLVENAVQHGVEPHAGEVMVAVSARLDAGLVRVAVRDNGAGVGIAVLGSGVGLRNVRQRLEALYGAAASLRLSMGTDGWTAAELTFPLPQGGKAVPA